MEAKTLQGTCQSLNTVKVGLEKVQQSWALKHLTWKDDLPYCGSFSVFSFSSAKDVETCFRYAFLVISLSKRQWMLWILVYSHKFLTWHRCNFLVLNGGTEEKIWSDECAHKGKRMDRQEDPSRPKDSSTERYYLWKAGLTPRCVSLWQHKGFSTQRIGLLRTNPTRRVSVIDETMSELSSFAANTRIGLKWNLNVLS